MKTSKLLRFVSLLAVVSFCAICTIQAENSAAVADVLKLKTAGVTEETIVAFIQGKNLNYDLSADNILTLKDKGISPAVLNAMLASGAPSTPPPLDPKLIAPQGPTPPPQSPSPAPTPALTPGPTAPPAASPDLAYFRQELSPYGRWILVEDGRWCWQPTLVVSTPGWRPYWDKGHWIWTDQGWFWASDYSWGWAVFHYGRWELHPHHGWVWHPDRVWGPAWVTWRSGGDYCGWAPLPPGAIYDIAGGYFRFQGRRVEAGFDFGLGAAHFAFCFTREIGQPMRQHFHDQAEIRGIFSRTAIINNYSVKRVIVGSETHTQVFNHGIDPARLPHDRTHTFEPVHIEELHTPAPGRAHEHFDPRRRTLEVYRPGFGGHH